MRESIVGAVAILTSMFGMAVFGIGILDHNPSDRVEGLLMLIIGVLLEGRSRT